jgi:hypothetical protein
LYSTSGRPLVQTPAPQNTYKNTNAQEKWTRLAYKEISSKNQMKVYLAIYNKI